MSHPNTTATSTNPSVNDVDPGPMLHSPATLLHDTRLTPIERNAWQVLRAHADGRGLCTLTSYEALRPFLTCSPRARAASAETVVRAIIVLRLTGWLSRVYPHRDALPHLRTNQYEMHAKPLSLAAACHRDAGYLALLDQAFEHASQLVRQVAWRVLSEGAVDPAAVQRLPQRLRDRLSAIPLTTDDDRDGPTSSAGESTLHDHSPSAFAAPLTEPATTEREDNEPASPISDDRDGGCDGDDVRTSTKALYEKNVRTARVRAREAENESEVNLVALPLPRCLAHVAADQHRDVTQALQRLPQAQRQDVLNELEARSRRGTVRDVVAYLFGLIRRALAGEFRVWAGRQPASATPAPAAPPPPPAASPRQPVSPRKPAVIAKPERASDATAHACITQLRELLRMPDFRGLSTAPVS